MFFTAVAGYVGPALFGLGAAYLLRVGHSVGLLWALLVLLVLVLILIRNWFGLWLVLAATVVVFAVSWWGSALLQSCFAYVGAWFLLLAAPRPVVELQSARRRGLASNSDADTLAAPLGRSRAGLGGGVPRRDGWGARPRRTLAAHDSQMRGQP